MKNVAKIQHLICLISGLLLLLAIPLWLFWIAPELTKIPNSFSYKADILSLDNFYDESLKKFEGEQISKTKFGFSVLEVKPLYFTIEGLFSVRTQNDKPIFSVMRLYYINPYTGAHVTNGVNKVRNGYLFAPRYLHGQDFYYWHLNYEAPALMKFVNEEQLNGLTVEHYQAELNADQTGSLGNLPGVPMQRGVQTKTILQLWIEPISGWMVKYQDNTIASYYDQKTHSNLGPWNKFSNRYTENSVRLQVMNAQQIKWKILVTDWGVPILLLIFAVILLCIYYLHAYRPQYILNVLHRFSIKVKDNIVTYISIILIVSMGCELSFYIFWHRVSHDKYLIGISRWNDNPEMLEAVRGFKAGLEKEGFKEGDNISFIEDNPSASIEKQANIIQSFLNKKVALIFTLTTPGALIAKGITNKTPIVFSGVTYPEESNIIDSLITSKNNLVGTLNYIPPAQQFHAVEKIYPDTKALGFIHRKGDPNSEIQYQEFKTMLNKRGIIVNDMAVVDTDDLREQLQNNTNNILYLACDTLLQGPGGQVVTAFGRESKMPVISCNKDNVLKGALIGYVADYYTMGKYAGQKAALILQGAEPSWLHTEYPGQGILMINLVTARILGITITPEMKQQADQLLNK